MIEKDRLSASSILNYLKWEKEEIDICSLDSIKVDISGASVYTVKDGDRLDLLAYQFYGDPRLWWVVAIANKDKIINPLDIKPSTELLIPSSDAVYTLMNTR